MLLGDDSETANQELTEFVELPHPSQNLAGNYSKKNVVSVG